jgi:glycerophosphoryl diester phosphodiesterase
VEEAEDADLNTQLQRLGFTPTVYSPHYGIVDEELIKQCHEKGMKVIPWTVNDKKEITKIKKMGVDGIITDYPDLIK